MDHICAVIHLSKAKILSFEYRHLAITITKSSTRQVGPPCSDNPINAKCFTPVQVKSCHVGQRSFLLDEVEHVGRYVVISRAPSVGNQYYVLCMLTNFYAAVTER